MEDPNIHLIKYEESKFLDKIKNLPKISHNDYQQIYETIEEANKNLKKKIEENENTYQELCKSYNDLTSDFEVDVIESNPRAKLEEVKQSRKEVDEKLKTLIKTLHLKEEDLRNLKKSNCQKDDLDQSLPKMRKEYDLLASTFSIKWDKTAPENLVKGVGYQAASHEVIPFSLDKNSNSQFFITNFLWKRMHPAEPFLEKSKPAS